MEHPLAGADSFLARLIQQIFGRNAEVQVQLLTNQRVISDKCLVAMCFYTRLTGLIGRTSLQAGEGMLFPRCNNIHMWFMQTPIDVVFIRTVKREDGTLETKVTSAHSDVRPWRVFPLMDANSTDTLELPPGTIRHCELKPGDEVCIA